MKLYLWFNISRLHIIVSSSEENTLKQGDFTPVCLVLKIDVYTKAESSV